jgi:hypothetical protein
MGREHGPASRRCAESADRGAFISASAKLAAALLLVLAGAVAAHLFDPGNWPALAIDIMHSLHGTGFAILSLFVYWLLQRRYPQSFNYVIAAGVTMGIGLLSEAAQVPGPRAAELSDLIEDGLGILGALGLLAAFDHRVRQQLRAPAHLLLSGGAAIALGIACLPSVWYTYALIEQKRAFPAIVTFESAWERSAFYVPRDEKPARLVPPPESWIADGNTIARFEEAGRWGIFLVLKTVTNWRGYNKLTFVAASDGEPFVLDIGIRDRPDKSTGKEQAVFYKTFVAGPEPRRYSIGFDEIGMQAAHGPLDFSRVESVVLSAAKPGSGVKILLDDFRLER